MSLADTPPDFTPVTLITGFLGTGASSGSVRPWVLLANNSPSSNSSKPVRLRSNPASPSSNRLLMTEAPVPSLYGFEGIFSAMLQISRFVVSHELDDTRP